MLIPHGDTQLMPGDVVTALGERGCADEVVAMLNRRHFFYSGVFFSFYHNEDYLRLQRKNSRFVDEEQLVCYSQNAKAMLEYIQDDERRVAPAGTQAQ